MADFTISDLTSASTLDGSELVECEQGGNSRSVTTAEIAALGGGGTEWSAISTTTISGSPAYIEWTGLNCEEMFILCNALTISTAATIQIQFDAGGGYGPALTLSSQIAGPFYGTLILTGMLLGNLQAVGNLGANAFPISVSTNLRLVSASIGAQITGVKLTTSAGTFGTSGSIDIQTR